VKTDGSLACWGDGGQGQLDVPAPDFTATKTRDTDGPTAPGKPWLWTISITNTGRVAATYQYHETIILDQRPDSGLTYGAGEVLNYDNVICPRRMHCPIDGSPDLRCRPAGEVIIRPGGSFDVQFSATPSAGGVFNNPRAAGICRVDPDSLVAESDEGNNDCSDSGVRVIYATISLAGDDLQLDWPDLAASGYYVWTSTDDPYFVPGADCGAAANCSLVPGTSHLDTGAGTDGNNHFYIVEAVSGSGEVFSYSNRVAKFFFGLAPGEPDPG
jgi:hypothetical protein